MTLDEFKQELVKLGYKVTHDYCAGSYWYTVLTNRKRRVSIQNWTDYQNVFYHKETAQGSYDYYQHDVTDFKKALANILKFERKIK